jgi:hypothetical protein
MPSRPGNLGWVRGAPKGQAERVETALPPFEQEVLSVVQASLAAHGEDAAEVTYEWAERARMWFITITPRRDNGASVSVWSEGDELLLTFGQTRLELWNSKRGPAPMAQLSEYLHAIFAGDFEEAGSGDDRFTRQPGKWRDGIGR